MMEIYMHRKILNQLLVIVLSVGCCSSLVADDWSRWMGPNRNNTWNESGTLDKFPEGGPKSSGKLRLPSAIRAQRWLVAK